jgi:hypothetical protein
VRGRLPGLVGRIFCGGLGFRFRLAKARIDVIDPLVGVRLRQPRAVGDKVREVLFVVGG